MVERIYRPTTGVYQPTDRTTLSASFTPINPPTSIVGAGLQWSDQDLGTYAEVWHIERVNGWEGDYLAVDFAPIPAGAQIVGGVVHYTVTAHVGTPGSQFEQGVVEIPSRAFTAANVEITGDQSLTRVDSIHQPGVPQHYVGSGSFAQQLQQGPVSIRLHPSSRSSGIDVPLHVATIHEAWIVVDVPGGRSPHNRIVQRGNDGLGLTGGQRVVQRRTVQSSNRAVGIR